MGKQSTRKTTEKKFLQNIRNCSAEILQENYGNLEIGFLARTLMEKGQLRKIAGLDQALLFWLLSDSQRRFFAFPAKNYPTMENEILVHLVSLVIPIKSQAI